MSFSLPNTFSQTIALLTAVCCLMLFSCGEEAEIRSYEIPSEYTGPVVSWELRKSGSRLPLHMKRASNNILL